MGWVGRIVHLALPRLAIGAVCACGTFESVEAGSGAMLQDPRRVVGAAAPYEPESFDASTVASLATSLAAQRALGWRVVERVLRPVAIAHPREGATTLPVFRTWLDATDIGRVANKLAESPGSEVETVMNEDASMPIAQSEREALERWIEQEKPTADQLASTPRVAYSPGFVKALLEQRSQIGPCVDRRADGGSDESCVRFPRSAAMVKAAWSRFAPVVRETDAVTMTERLRGARDRGGWPFAGPTVDAGPTEIATAHIDENYTFRLTGLHVVTKELDDWVWVTLWWSAKPDDDFGSDRPASIQSLGEPWTHYKMCAVTSFEAPTDRTGVPDALIQSLDALKIEGDGRSPTWCSNPYLEKGAHNAQTNCIGCHAHAGFEPFDEKDLLASQVTRSFRPNFTSAADYSWSLGSGTSLLSLVKP